MPVDNLKIQHEHLESREASYVRTYHRPLERVCIFLQLPQRIRLILCPANHLRRRSCHRPSEILQNVLELVSGWRGFRDIELELGPLERALCLVAASLVFRRMSYRVCIGLLEQGEHSGRRLIVRFVEEGDDVFGAMLQEPLVWRFWGSIERFHTSPKSFLNMIADGGAFELC